MNETHTDTTGEVQELDDARERLFEVAKKIEAWRTAHEIPGTRMHERFPNQLKSYRSVERALKRDFSEMKTDEAVEKHLASLEAVWSLINTPKPKPVVRVRDDFPVALALRDAFVRTMTKTDINRFILLIATTGRGKSSALKALKQIYKDRIIIVQATSFWRGKPLGLVQEIWKALGKTDELGNGPQALTRLKAELQLNRIAIGIDEGHYLDAPQLNCITTLVNDTPGEFIIVAQPSLWGRLERDKGVFLETRQLTRNRLSRKLVFGDLTDGDTDIAKLIDHRAKWLNGRSADAAKLLMKEAPQNGNLGFVRNVLERCEEAIEEGAPRNWDTFAAAVKAELAER